MTTKLLFVSQKLPSYGKQCVTTFTRCFATQGTASSNDPQMRNLFEVYQKNSHWMGVYKRHPIVEENLSLETLKTKVQQEKQKNISISLPHLINPREAIWNEKSKRTGAVGKKIGTTTLWTKEGFTHQVSVVQILDCHVLDTQMSREDDGKDRFTQMLVGACDITDEKYLAGMSRRKMEWYDKLGVFPKQFWTAFQVTKEALLLPGTEITASHFQAGQHVSIKAKTIDRGFQGVMKRWGMKGQPASHGQSKTHRKMGATGGGQDPGRIFPKKKMAGNMGGTFRRTPPLKLLRINTKYNLLFIKGPIPGPKDGFCIIMDGANRPYVSNPPPFPTHFADQDDILDEDLYADYVCKPTDPSLEFEPYKI